MSEHAVLTQILTRLFNTHLLTMTSWYVLNGSSGLSHKINNFFFLFSYFLNWAVLQFDRSLKTNRCQTTDRAPEYLFGFDR